MKRVPLALPDNRLRRPLDDILGDAHAEWQPLLQRWRAGGDGRRLARFLLARQMAGADMVPARPLRALEQLRPGDVRVVVLGQDPYHGPGQAEGLAFSVPAGVPWPPSLRNIRLELARSLGCRSPAPAAPAVAPPSGSLAGWADQGVLLLNTVLTVELGRPASHAQQGWEALTDDLILHLWSEDQPMVFMLWGAQAQAKQRLLDAAGANRLVLCANHPSPLSARRPPVPFIGCDHFRLAAEWLAQRQPQVPPLDWGR